jgi:hypothetical protein
MWLMQPSLKRETGTKMNLKINYLVALAVLCFALLACGVTAEPLHGEVMTQGFVNTNNLVAHSDIELTTTGSVNLRSAPDNINPGSNVTAVLPSGTAVRWIGLCKQIGRQWWVGVELSNKQTGWVAQDWLSGAVCASSAIKKR